MYIHTHVHTFLHTNTDKHLHTYMHANIHTYIHTHVHTYIQIRRNEFGWLLKHKIAELDEDGTLPPRFAGLTGGGMKRNLTRPQHTPSKRRKDASGAGGKGSKTPVDSDEDSMTRIQRARNTRIESSSVEQPPKQAVEYYSTLAMAPSSEREAAELSEKGKRDLVRRWLRRKLYEEVQEQAFAFSRGVRDVVPAGLLQMFSAVELQGMLGGGNAVNNAALADWKKHAEYGNGLDAAHQRVKWFWQAVAALSPAVRADVWRYATGRNQPPDIRQGGCGSMDTKFNLVARGGDKPDDGALITAATCHKQLQMPCYSSAQVTAQQLVRSVEEGLASAESGDSESFEAVQRRLMAKVQEEVAAAGAQGGGAAVQAAMRKLFPNSFMCGKCSFGPVDHANCADLRSHHGEDRGFGVRVSNACPKCGWFSDNIADWPPWDGRVWEYAADDAVPSASNAGGPSSSRKRLRA